MPGALLISLQISVRSRSIIAWTCIATPWLPSIPSIRYASIPSRLPILYAAHKRMMIGLVVDGRTSSRIRHGRRFIPAPISGAPCGPLYFTMRSMLHVRCSFRVGACGMWEQCAPIHITRYSDLKRDIALGENKWRRMETGCDAWA